MQLDGILKVIIETALLTDEEKQIACLLAKEAGADFVKTSTGFSTAGATVEDVALMRRTVGPLLGVKAAGGVRTREDLRENGQSRRDPGRHQRGGADCSIGGQAEKARRR